LQPDSIKEQLEGILERALNSYHRDERHGGASWMTERVLDAELASVAREAFLDADNLPTDHEVLHTLDSEPLQLLGEGYHVMALLAPMHHFVAKYAKYRHPVPPLAAAAPERQHEWSHDHGVRADGLLHPAIWQHIRAFEAYGALAVPSRVYIADDALPRLATDERRALERFRTSGVVRSLGGAARRLHVQYPDDFPSEKRAPDGVMVSVVVAQPLVTPIAVAIERALRQGDVAAARGLEARYDEFTQELWRCGVSHLDFSMLNIGIVGSGNNERLQIFDPHMGVIEVADGAPDVRDPLSAARSIDNVLRSARDGSRWALWRVQQDVTATNDVAPEAAGGAVALVRDFHDASEGLEEGRGSFGRERFAQTWQRRRTHMINTVMHAQLWTLVRHPLGERLRSMLDPAAPDEVYNRSMAVLAMDHDRPLPQFRARLTVHENRPLMLVANVGEHTPKLVKHWGRLQLPAELDVQDDPAIHYHFRDLFTGEMYVRPGDQLARSGLALGLAPYVLHVLAVEDVMLADMAVERSVAAHRDISEFLEDCTKRVGVVGDVHGELQALKEVLLALGFIDASGNWFARDGTLVFTGDVGHGRHLQDVFDYIHYLAAQAHRAGGRIVWTLGNHDLYLDREGGQGGEDSLGYRLWPKIREAALHPERHPGLLVQAAYFDHGKLFVHAGVLPNIVDLAKRERGADDAETVASYINDVLRQTLVERERITARDLPHEIFHIGTSHTRERRLPGEIGYEPAGVFTPDLRELDHYRYHTSLLPQVVGHTASRMGEIRYSPGSWLGRDYIAIDVGRQHGTGNGGLLLTDFGWVEVTPGGPARLVEVGPLFVKLAHEAADETWPEGHGDRVAQMLSAYFRVAKPERRPSGKVEEAFFAELSPRQVVAFEQFLAAIEETGECAVITDLDEMLTAFRGGVVEEDTTKVLAQYLAAGGVLVFSSDASFESFYAGLLRPLIGELGPRSLLFANVLLILSGGAKVFAAEDGAYRLMSNRAGRAASEALNALSRLDPERMAYIGDSLAPRGLDHALAGRVGTVIDVGDAVLATPGEAINNLHRSYLRTIEVIAAATRARLDYPSTTLSATPPEIGETVLWTFERREFRPGRRLRVRVGGSGFVHCGVMNENGAWDPVYNVPLMPLSDGAYEAVLPSGVNVFTFFWTEAPWAPNLPGHWERGSHGTRVFSAREQ
jgi:hypothetical protein